MRVVNVRIVISNLTRSSSLASSKVIFLMMLPKGLDIIKFTINLKKIATLLMLYMFRQVSCHQFVRCSQKLLVSGNCRNE